MPIKTAAIVGAGVAGLSAALALARHGIESDIIEQAAQLSEVGAGLQISPNASRILDALGVLDTLKDKWNEPDWLNLMDGRRLKPLTALPAGQFAQRRWGAPYGVLHRATLQQALLQAVIDNPLCRLHLDARLLSPDRASVEALTGRAAAMTIGADGVWSVMRAAIANSPKVDFSGNIAWRFTVPRKDAPDFLRAENLMAFLGPDSHLVSYPLRETDAVNVVAITAGATTGETWASKGSDAERAMLVRRFARWHPAVRQFLAGAPDPSFWPLYQAGDGRWHNDRDTVLIGDAAHAMMPFAAQGAGMAIEDAFALASAVATRPLGEALLQFEQMRKPRIAKVRRRADLNRFAYHARGPFRLGRDMVFSLRPPERLAADLDWLYGYRCGL
ncbi:FAD-dependent monooxygenase [Rhizobium halophytocola]|uniref:Salicylate hydroxylase n=1 Tax=Rhizobium halophytocola TaxID=735519 RepID=A0ABS4DW79_9HYPH|nr:FAD-dependent monooxygenase [Rhizobium halophytocola]MBP1849925.1 salicylate hydroxylase [Rhizobium halophytocola]